MPGVVESVARALFLSRPLGRRLADRDERLRAPRLDAGVARRGDLRVVGRADDLPRRVELRREEVAQVRLVPDPVEADERIAGVAAGVAGGERAREVLEVGRLRRQVHRPLVLVRPLGRAPDRHQHLEPADLRIPDELVQVVEAVGAVERVRRPLRPSRRDVPPVDERAHDRRARAAHLVELGLAASAVAQHRVVVEADPHPLRGRGGAGRDGEQEHDCDSDCAGENGHGRTSGTVAEDGQGTDASGGRPHERATRLPDAATRAKATSGSGPREWTLRT